jgi:hypothetical protein
MMREHRSTVLDFVRAIVRAELAEREDATDADAAQRIIRKLRLHLGKVIGPAGFDVLLARALVLARRSHPALSKVRATAGGGLAGIEGDLPQDAAVSAGALSVVANFLELLIGLIGEDLVARLLRGVWPAAEDNEEK